jgi:hypothetical protein
MVGYFVALIGRDRLMPQLHLPMFPAGVTHITSELALAKKDGEITYSYQSCPIRRTCKFCPAPALSNI